MSEQHTDLGIVAIAEQGQAGNNDVEDAGASLLLLALLQVPVLSMALFLGLHLHDGIIWGALHVVLSLVAVLGERGRIDQLLQVISLVKREEQEGSKSKAMENSRR